MIFGRSITIRVRKIFSATSFHLGVVRYAENNGDQ